MKKEVTSITLLGEELSIKFNLAVECAYEKIAGKPFDLNDLVSQTSSTALYMAAILESKPDTEITVERLMREATGPEIEQLSKAVVAAMTKWLDMPDVLKKLQKDDKTEKKAKN